MKEVDKRKTNNKQQRRSVKNERIEHKQCQENGGKDLNAKETESKASIARRDSGNLVSDSNTGAETSEVYENGVTQFVDDDNRFEEVPLDLESDGMDTKVNKDEIFDDHSSDYEKQAKQGKEDVSDSETVKDSISSQEDSLSIEGEKVEKASRVPKSKHSSQNDSPGSRVRPGRQMNKLQNKGLPNTPKKTTKTGRGSLNFATESSGKKSNNMKVPTKPSSESSEGVDDKPIEEMKEIDLLDETSNGAQSVASDSETVDTEESGEHVDEANLNQKIGEMELRIEKLEEELRDVAALEISLYSVVPEHGSSAHKVHTPARRLSRLYIHACKHWTQNKRATIAKNSVSGLVLVAKSCGNDVSRLTFWLSNTIVLREIIYQAFGNSHNSTPVTRFSESNGVSKRSEGNSPSLKWKAGSGNGNKQLNGCLQFVEDWQEMGTLTAALEKVESWIFSRLVESVWWQALTPHMQSPVALTNKTIGKLLGPALGDQQQGSFSINLWKNAFQDALQKLCPVRAAGHECGCLPVLGRMVMERCVARLDVAMFNAILRESANEIPTDPVSDPILDSKVLPIPAGDLSFGSGAQLKNSVGNWSRWLTDMFGMDTDDFSKEDQDGNDDRRHGVGEPKSFILLNSLSDLLMLPKDMLMDRSIRREVCPLISLPLVKRILCNFTPDEFCPDAVPGAVLEALNAESIVERRLSEDSGRSFPYTAAPVVYTPPSSSVVAEKVAEAGGKSQLLRNVSSVQRKGYTSDEELEELDAPLASIIEKLPPSPTVIANENGNGKHKDHTCYTGSNARYELLREVWSS